MQSSYLPRRLTRRVLIKVITLFVLTGVNGISFSKEITPTLKNLSSFLTQLEGKHPQLKANQSRREAAAARTRAASQPIYNPEIELDAERISYNREGRAEVVTLGINQTLDWNNKRAARKNIAIAEQHLTQFQSETIQQQLIANIFSALADYQIQKEIIQSHTKRLQLAKQILAQGTRLYKAGEISKLELEQIRLEVSRKQLTFNQAKTQSVAYELSLEKITGVKRNQWPILPTRPPLIVPAKLNYEQILNNLPLIKADTTRIVVARSKMRLRVRELKPDPTIGIRAGGDDSNGIIGVTLSIPLNIRNRFYAEVDEARANIRLAESNLQNTRHQLRTQLQAAAQSYQLTYNNWVSWQKVASSSLQNQTKLLMRLWRAGELSTSDYLLQLNQIKAAELNNVELKGNIWKAWFNWLASSNQFKQWLNNK